MKKIFMLLLMAVAAVSAWGQEEKEINDVAALRKKYMNFLLGPNENALREFGFWGFVNREVFAIYDEQRGLIIRLEWLRRPQVRERFQEDVLSAKKRLEGKDFQNYGVYKGLNMDCCLSFAGKDEEYTFAKL